MPEPKLIYSKIATIQKEVGAIPKNGQGPANKGSFAFIKAEDVLDKIHALLVEHEVIVVPKIKYVNHEVIRDQGRSNIYSTIEVEYRYIAVEDGSEIITTSVGEGSDIGSDTATRKAATQALKISHLHMFTIPNSEFDDEGYEPPGGGEEKSNRTVAKARQAAEPKGASSAQLDSLTKIRASVKAAAGKLGLSSQEINERGQKIDPDFFANPHHLKTLLSELEAELK